MPSMNLDPHASSTALAGEALLTVHPGPDLLLPRTKSEYNAVMAAAYDDAERLRQRCFDDPPHDDTIAMPFQFDLPETWMQAALISACRRYGLVPVLRFRTQHVFIVVAPNMFMREVFEPHYGVLLQRAERRARRLSPDAAEGGIFSDLIARLQSECLDRDVRVRFTIDRCKLRLGGRNSLRMARERALELARKNYPGLPPSALARVLCRHHRITVQPMTLRGWMIADGLWSVRKRTPAPAPVELGSPRVDRRLVNFDDGPDAPQLTEQAKFRALCHLFADYFADGEKPETDGRLDVLEAKVRHLLATPHRTTTPDAEAS